MRAVDEVMADAEQSALLAHGLMVLFHDLVRSARRGGCRSASSPCFCGAFLWCVFVVRFCAAFRTVNVYTPPVTTICYFFDRATSRIHAVRSLIRIVRGLAWRAASSASGKEWQSVVQLALPLRFLLTSRELKRWQARAHTSAMT
eukprot:SAG11_NODE_2386_length_3418_cov_1.215728_5_plen_145_part_00